MSGKLLSKRTSTHLDMIRGISALVVLLGHVRNLLFLDYPYLGASRSLFLRVLYALTGLGHEAVMVFFVLSGFFIAGSVRKSFGHWSWKHYLVGRLSRLYLVLIPALLLTGIADAIAYRLPQGPAVYDHPIAHFSDTPLSNRTSPAAAIGNLFFLQGIVVLPYGSNGPLWSLANEFWYYMLFPLAALAVGRAGNIKVRSAYLLGTYCILAALPRVIQVGFIIWLMGAAIEFLPEITLSRRGVRRVLLAVTATAFSAAVILVRLKLFTVEGGDIFLGTTFAVWLYVLIRIPAGARSELPSAYSRIAVVFSACSFSVYAIHFPLLMLIRTAVGPSVWSPTPWHLFMFALISVGLFCSGYLFSLATESHTEVVRRWLFGAITRADRQGSTAVVQPAPRMLAARQPARDRILRVALPFLAAFCLADACRAGTPQRPPLNSGSDSRPAGFGTAGTDTPLHENGPRVVFDVLRAGAKPDGRSDSRAAIQRAIDSVARRGGGIVKFPKGVFLLNSYLPSVHPWMFYNLRVPSGILLEGEPGATLLQGPAGRAPLPLNATSVENDVLVFGSARFKEVTFQSPSLNGGFFKLYPTLANNSSVRLSVPSEAGRFRAGDYVGIYSAVTGDVIASETSQVISVDRHSGTLELKFGLARSFPRAFVVNITALATVRVGMRNLTVQGAVPLLVSEVFDFSASNCRFLYDAGIGGGNVVTPMVAVTARGFKVEKSGFEPVGPIYASVELPQRNSQDVVFDQVTFRVRNAGFGEYAAHWTFTKNTFWISPNESVTAGIAIGGLDVQLIGNTIRGGNITAGGGFGALVTDTNGPAEYARFGGRVRFQGNDIECRADGNNCVLLSSRDPIFTGNRIRATGTASGIKVEGPDPQSVRITHNRIYVADSPAIVLNSPARDSTLLMGNTLSGRGRYGIYVASPAWRQEGGHTIAGNTISGFSAPLFMNRALHPGTTVR